MTPDVERVSAKIYQFPIKRMSLRSAETQPPADYCAAALDSCWYHDEAVRQERTPPRHD
ncbi:hypothetical protein ABID21_001570 [Pseudorhizobium tarimense]|uniref:Glutamine synthetase n=2 Tax=Pseudorhizobium tarimense TaxID=1079109 RepID=A0ABV2H4J2_9HYPH